MRKDTIIFPEPNEAEELLRPFREWSSRCTELGLIGFTSEAEWCRLGDIKLGGSRFSNPAKRWADLSKTGINTRTSVLLHLAIATVLHRSLKLESNPELLVPGAAFPAEVSSGTAEIARGAAECSRACRAALYLMLDTPHYRTQRQAVSLTGIPAHPTGLPLFFDDDSARPPSTPLSEYFLLGQAPDSVFNLTTLRMHGNAGDLTVRGTDTTSCFICGWSGPVCDARVTPRPSEPSPWRLLCPACRSQLFGGRWVMSVST